jgi:predicted membrane protein
MFKLAEVRVRYLCGMLLIPTPYLIFGSTPSKVPALVRMMFECTTRFFVAGPVPEFAQTFLLGRQGYLAKLCEIFGSAETGGLAFRSVASQVDAVLVAV